MKFLFWLIVLAPFMLLAEVVAPVLPVFPVIPQDPTAIDLINAFMALVSNWKSWGWLGCSIVSINMIVAVLKADWTDKWFIWNTKAPLIKRAIILVLGQIAAIFLMINSGMKWYAAVIAGLITSGGAIAIYEALSPIFKKDPSILK